MPPIAPAIVCLGYNRPASLERLLGSLSRAHYPESGVTLVISLDRAVDTRCLDVAERFDWHAGPKRVLARTERAGLRQHVLECGDLVEEHGAIVMLEDDIVVAPGFYHYATAALGFYADTPEVAGISLYSHRTTVAAPLPFFPLPTGYDAFFLQFPASWGQAWTARQWRGFRDWLATAGPGTVHPDLPETVRRWPLTSWLKCFASYCVSEGRTWVYPYGSYTTNFGDAGFHMPTATDVYQVPLTLESGTAPRLPRPGATPADYDAHFENRSVIFARSLGIDPAEFECDLYGLKPLGTLRRRYLATSRPTHGAIMSTGMVYKPPELNLLHRPEGDDIRVAEREAVYGTAPPVDWRRFAYFWPSQIGVKQFSRIAAERLVRRILGRS
jgi:hypothetical protein